MDFLALCKKVASKVGTVAGISNLTTVVGVTGRLAQLVNAVSDAYVDIQNERNDWIWLNTRAAFSLTPGTYAYAPEDIGVTRLGRWLPDTLDKRTITIYDPAIGKADEGYITYIPYSVWEDRYEKGVHDNNRPTSWAIGLRGRGLYFGNTPDKAYAVRAAYRMSPQILAVDADIPEMPEQYHGLIVAEAIRIMSRDDEAYQPLQAQGDQYARLRNALVREQTPDVDMFFGGAIA